MQALVGRRATRLQTVERPASLMRAWQAPNALRYLKVHSPSATQWVGPAVSRSTGGSDGGTALRGRTRRLHGACKFVRHLTLA